MKNSFVLGATLLGIKMIVFYLPFAVDVLKSPKFVVGSKLVVTLLLSATLGNAADFAGGKKKRKT